MPEGAAAVYPHVGVQTFDSLVRLNSDSISPPGSTARHRGWLAASTTIISTFFGCCCCCCCCRFIFLHQTHRLDWPPPGWDLTEMTGASNAGANWLASRAKSAPTARNGMPAWPSILGNPQESETHQPH